MVSTVRRGVSDNHISPDSRGHGSWERGSRRSTEKVTSEKALEKGFKVELELLGDREENSRERQRQENVTSVWETVVEFC